MGRFRVRLNDKGMDNLLHSEGVEDDLLKRGEAVATQARQLAPVVSGAYRAGIEAVADDHPTRVAVHVSSSVPYAAIVEARLRVLGRAIDAARG